jgi:hypothetical protein
VSATRLRLAADDRIAALEERQKELYDLLAELRSAHAPGERIRELVLEIDEHDARVVAARDLPPLAPPLSEHAPPVLRIVPRAPLPAPAPTPTPTPTDEEPGLLGRMLIVGALVVAAAATVGVLVAGRGIGSPGAGAPVRLRTLPLAVPPASPVAPAAGYVPVRLQTHVAATPCAGSDARTALRWAWTLPPGYDGQPATIDATGPGLAGRLQRTVAGRRVGLAYTSPCLAPGATWTVSLETVGATPARLTGVEGEP